MSKKIVLFALGGLLIAAGLIYGFTDTLEQSIAQRSANIARWEGQLAKDGEEVKIALAEADRLGKEPASSGSGPSAFERKLAEVERKTQYMKLTGDRIERERGRKKVMMIATTAFVGAGLLAMLLGWRMRAKTA